MYSHHGNGARSVRRLYAEPTTTAMTIMFFRNPMSTSRSTLTHELRGTDGEEAAGLPVRRSVRRRSSSRLSVSRCSVARTRPSPNRMKTRGLTMADWRAERRMRWRMTLS
jgi:hypothetical protein